MTETAETLTSGHPCPKCGEVVDVYIDKYFGKVKCPKCGEIFKRNLLPDEVPVKRIKKPKEEKPERGRAPRRRRREEEEGLFKKAKTASEVLEDVLTDHGLKSEFIDYATKRSERMGGIHPNELWSMLKDMQSGVKSKSHIRYVVDDYYFYLQREQEIARQMGQRISYPLRFGREAETVGPYPGRLEYEEQYPPAYPQRYPSGRGGYAPSRGYRQAFGYQPPPLTREDAKEMFAGLLEEKAKHDELTKLNEKVSNMPEQTRKMIEETMEKMIPKEPTTPPDVVTGKQLMDTVDKMLKTANENLEKKDTNAYIKYLESHGKDMKDMQEKTLDTLIEERKERTKEMKELKEKIESVKRPISLDTKGYQRDETRLLADGLHILGQKSPIKELGSIMIKFMPPEQGEPPVREKVSGETSLLDLVPKDYQE